jgi:hypothetical protein
MALPTKLVIVVNAAVTVCNADVVSLRISSVLVAVFTGGREFEGCTSAATAALSVAWFVSTFIGSPLLGIVRSTAVFLLARLVL